MSFEMTIQDTFQHYLAPPSPESIGMLLASSRIGYKFEQSEVAKRLGLDLAVIEALEADDFQRLGPPVFVRSYLGRYARLLGLPEQTLLDKFKQSGLDQPPPLRVTSAVKPQAKITDIRWLSYPLILALAAWLGWLGLDRISSEFGFSNDITKPLSVKDSEPIIPLSNLGNETLTQGVSGPASAVSQPVTPTASLPPGQSAAVDGKRAGTEKPPSKDLETSANHHGSPAVANLSAVVPVSALSAGNTPGGNVAAPATAQPLKDRDQQPPGASTGAEAAVSQATAADGVAQLNLEFREDCWVDIKDADGKRLAYGVMKANTVQTLAGAAPFSLALGNPWAVRLSLNGAPVDKQVYLPHRGSVSRFVLKSSGNPQSSP